MDSRMTNKYILLLDNLNLIEYKEIERVYLITQKGHRYLEELKKLSDILELESLIISTL